MILWGIISALMLWSGVFIFAIGFDKRNTFLAAIGIVAIMIGNIVSFGAGLMH